MSNIIELLRQLDQAEAELQAAHTRATSLREQYRQEKAKRFIEANAIKRADVELSSGEEKPHFGMIYPFIEWLRRHSKKNWAEWNGGIYHMSDLLAGRMPPVSATMEDLPK